MAPTYAELSDAALARLAEENVAELMVALTRGLGGDLEQAGYLTRYADRSIVSPMFNGVVRSRIPDGRAEAAIAESLAYFAARERPLAFWWVGPSAEPPDLGERLLAAGLAPYEVAAPSMAADLWALPAALDVPAGFAIEVVGDVAGLLAWAEVFNASYGAPAFAGQAWAEATLRLGFGRAPYRLYLGRLRGEPVATNILFCGAGVASVYGVWVLREARGQGIGAAVTLRPYLDARAQGYRAGVLFATEEGLPVYRRLGFREVGAVSRYLWRG